MRIHVFQHVPFEGPAAIQDWAKKKGNSLTFTRFFEDYPEMPDFNQFDLLLIMGGPMDTHEEDAYPWLKQEKQWILKALQANKKVLGICLGAQLMSEVLGGTITRNPEKEIGWFPVEFLVDPETIPLFQDFPNTFQAFHWHGQTFSIPQGALHLIKSGACNNQAFLWKDRAVGLQFHLETTPESVQSILDHAGKEIRPAAYVQNGETMLKSKNFKDLNRLLEQLLSRLETL